jgi:hypothetical protein
VSAGDYEYFFAVQELVMQQLRERAERDPLVKNMFELSIAARDRIAYDY